MFGRNNKLDTTWLAKVGFFEGFSDDQLAAAAELGERVEAEAGAELTDQGRYGDVAFVVVEGRANVLMNGDYVATVGSGSMVGEMSILERRPRNATVVAETDMVLVAFSTEAFRSLLDESPAAKERVLALLDARSRANAERRG
ncbi:MAG: Crp/Fnr family transcriptional regulator [Acidimicrobiales bacterium]